MFDLPKEEWERRVDPARRFSNSYKKDTRISSSKETTHFARDLQERLGILALLAFSAPFRICKLQIPIAARETDPVSGYHLESITCRWQQLSPGIASRLSKFGSMRLTEGKCSENGQAWSTALAAHTPQSVESANDSPFHPVSW
jgi:hypothetical protein